MDAMRRDGLRLAAGLGGSAHSAARDAFDRSIGPGRVARPRAASALLLPAAA